MSIFIKKKFIGQNEVDGAKILVLNNQAVRAKAAGGSAVELFKLDAADKLQFLVSPKSSAVPAEGSDLSNKDYVDGQMSAEQSARQAAVASLEAAVDAEETARQEIGRAHV